MGGGDILYSNLMVYLGFRQVIKVLAYFYLYRIDQFGYNVKGYSHVISLVFVEQL